MTKSSTPSVFDTNVIINVLIQHFKENVSKQELACVEYMKSLSNQEIVIADCIVDEIETVFYRVVLKKYKFSDEIRQKLETKFKKYFETIMEHGFIYPSIPSEKDQGYELYKQVNKTSRLISLIDANLLAIARNREFTLVTLDATLAKVGKSIGIAVYG